MNDKPKAQTMRGKPVVSVEEPKRLPFEYMNTEISSDTLRPDHLIQRFFEVLGHAWQTKAEWLEVEYGVKVAQTDFDRWCNPHVDPGVYDRQDLYDLPTEREVSQRHDDVGSLIADLIDALAEVAPVGCSFGASEGDGASYGFWSFKDPDDMMDEARDMAREVEFDRTGELRDDPLEPGEPC